MPGNTRSMPFVSARRQIRLGRQGGIPPLDCAGRGVEVMSRRNSAILAVLCGVLFLDGLDISLVGVALPSIKADLGLDDSQLQWIVSGYVLGYGACSCLAAGRRTCWADGARC